MKKKALLVGISGYQLVQPLKSAVNDLLEIEALLISEYGFAFEDIRVLCDSRATKTAIQAALRELLSGNEPGDMAVFYFTGHGYQVEAGDRNEQDLLDEVIITYSEDKLEYITDDTLYNLFAGMTPGLNFVCILDCCHSGVDDIRLPALPGHIPEQPPYVILSSSDATQRSWQVGSKASIEKHGYEWWEDNKYHSAFTFYLIKLLRMFRGNLSYRELVEKIRLYLKIHNYVQHPQVFGKQELIDAKVFFPCVQREA